jgi:hypothetical protein
MPGYGEHGTPLRCASANTLHESRAVRAWLGYHAAILGKVMLHGGNGSASCFHRVTSSKQKEAPQAWGLLATLGSSSKEEQWWYNLRLAFTTSIAAEVLLQIPT